MAASQNHGRSNSLPSKPHPLVLQCNEHLCRLEASDASSSFTQKLSVLQDLHESVEKLVHLSLTRQVLVDENRTEELLDGSLRLLDVCTAAKDALLHTKECAREVQSIMRRKRGGEVEIIAEVRKYLTSRKIVKKAIIKALSKCKISHTTNKGHHQNTELVRLLKDVEVVTISILESLLKFISGPTQSKTSHWSLVSKLMHNKRVCSSSSSSSSCTQETDENEFTKADAALQAFVFHTSGRSENLSHMQKQLENLEPVIQDLVEVLDLLFRRFIKIRVAILNIINH